MQFRLTYEGLLLGASRNNTRAAHKHQIRQVFHKQLKKLFDVHPAFEALKQVTAEGEPKYEHITRRHEQYGYRFFPLATNELSLSCTVRVLFLRPDLPGHVISSGDIDNRMKTIFDALRLPHSEAELGGHVPQEDENPFVVLLEDDN